MSPISAQILDAIGIMFLGMVLVFIFLSLLIVMVNIIAHLCTPKSVVKESQSEQVIQQPQQVARSLDPSEVEPKLLAAITTAIFQYRAQAAQAA